MAVECLPEASGELVDAVRRVHLSLGYYPARFPYDVAVRFFSFIDEVLGLTGSVLDPFVGSGVSCTSARLFGYRCIGYEINPFALLLARVSSSVITRDDVDELERRLDELRRYRGPGWRPVWSNIDYWYPPVVLRVLERLWGYANRQDNPDSIHAGILRIALARASRYFSYADPDVPKLYRGKGVERLESLLKGKTPSEVEEMIIEYVRRRSMKIASALLSYSSIARAGPQPELYQVDVARQPLPGSLGRVEAVFTSPPYLAAHEYTRSTKLELYWLNNSDMDVRRLKRMEIPYARVEPYKVRSHTFERFKRRIELVSPRMLAIYQNYFWSLARVLDKIVDSNPAVVGLFVGSATVKGIPIPIHDILSEHLSSRGYSEHCRYTSTIKVRKLFRKRNNDNPYGITEETLVILKQSRRHR